MNLNSTPTCIYEKIYSANNFASFLVIIQSAQAQQFTLVKRGTAKSRIIIPEKATVVEIQAAKVLQDYIQRISGASLAIECG